MKLLIIVVTLLLIGCSTTSTTMLNNQKVSKKISTLSDYREAQREYRRKNYLQSIELFEEFIEENKARKNKIIKKRVLWAIDLVSRIYLRVYKDPARAINFLEKVQRNVVLNDAEGDIILEWISVSKEWRNHGILPKKIKNKEELFELGEKYYLQGMEKIEFPADDSGNADFYIAATYLVPYVYNYDDSKNIGKALFMLGNIRFRSWNDYEYWTENFYLKEVIRRYPGSKLAKRAYKALASGVKAGYTGSGGDLTPPSQLRMLKVFKKLANPKK